MCETAVKPCSDLGVAIPDRLLSRRLLACRRCRLCLLFSVAMGSIETVINTLVGSERNGVTLQAALATALAEYFKEVTFVQEESELPNSFEEWLESAVAAWQEAHGKDLPPIMVRRLAAWLAADLPNTCRV